MQYAYLDNNVVIALSTDPIAQYGQTLGSQFLPCPDEVALGWVYHPTTQTWTVPPIPKLSFENCGVYWDMRRYDLRNAARDVLVQAALEASPNWPEMPTQAEWDAILATKTLEDLGG